MVEEVKLPGVARGSNGNTVRGYQWGVVINIDVELVAGKTKDECMDMHLPFAEDKEFVKQMIEERFGETKEGIIAHEHDDNGRCHMQTAFKLPKQKTISNKGASGDGWHMQWQFKTVNQYKFLRDNYCGKPNREGGPEDPNPLTWGYIAPSFYQELALMPKNDRLKKILNSAPGADIAFRGDVRRFQRNFDDIAQAYEEVPEIELTWPETLVQIPSEIREWFEMNCVNRREGQRGEGCIVYGKRGTGKSTFFSSMAGQTPGDNNFAVNPYIIYVNGGGTIEAFNKPYAKLIMFDDFTGWSGQGDALKNIMVGTGVSGLPIKGTIVSNVPALPCVFITNKRWKYDKMWESDKYTEDCVFWDVDEPLYPPFYNNRRRVQVIQSRVNRPQVEIVHVGEPRLKKKMKMTSDEKLIAILRGGRRPTLGQITKINKVLEALDVESTPQNSQGSQVSQNSHASLE